MNAYTDACLVEQRGMAVLLPFLESRAWRGQVIRVAKGPLAKHFQRSFGDLLIATGPGNVASVQIKAQRRWTGNPFLEVWSNKNLGDRGSHIEHGSTPGWLTRVRGHWAFKAGHGPVNSLIWLDFDWELRRKQLK